MSHYGPAAAASRGNGPRPNRRPPFGNGGPQPPPPPPPPPPRHSYDHRRQELPPPPPPPPRRPFPHHGRPMVQGRGHMVANHHGNNNFVMPPPMHNAHINVAPPPPPPPPPDQQRMNPNNFAPQMPMGHQPRQHPARGMVPYPNAPPSGHMFHPGNAPVMHPQQQQQQQLLFQQGGGPPQMYPPMQQQQQQQQPRTLQPVVHLQQALPHHSIAQHQNPPPSTIQQQMHPSSTAPTPANLPRPSPQSHMPPVSSSSTQQYSTQTKSNVSESADSSNAWAEHTSPTGIPYYYNSITGISTYDRPAALPVKNNTSSTPDKPRVWKTYTDESTGRKYYSDGVTTTWNRPPELPDEETPVKTTNTKRVSIAEDGAAPKKRRKGKEEEALYSNKAEAVAAFKGLLLAKDIAPNAKWNDVVRICSDDPRWEACTTIGERKQALAEYQTKRSNELRDVKRHEKLRAKEAYQRLLTDVLSESSHDFSSPGTSCRFADVRELLSKDDRFHAVEDEATREELFYDFVEELRKREERTKRNKKREAKEGFLTLLRLYEEQGKLSFASTWTSFLSQLEENEKNDPKFLVSENMSDSDRQLFFADFVIQLQTAEDEKQRRILEARQRAEKAQRDAYRLRLREMAETGLIRPGTRWRSIEDKLACDPSYPPVYAQRRETPRELFEDFVDEWNDEYRRERAVLNRALGLAQAKFKFDENTTLEEFKKKLLELSSPMPDLYSEIRRILIRDDALSSCWLFFNERMAEAKSENGHGGGQILDGEESSEDEGEIIESN
eukprot:CCRYP_000545-RA/>CCRYP_000545-RA protein AED:0.00 eAED:0.00 QI:92/1/1/1/1/1/2/169/778